MENEILEALRAKPQTLGELKDATGLSYTQLKTAIATLKHKFTDSEVFRLEYIPNSEGVMTYRLVQLTEPRPIWSGIGWKHPIFRIGVEG